MIQSLGEDAITIRTASTIIELDQSSELAQCIKGEDEVYKKEILTPIEVADILKVSKSLVYEMIRQGKIPSVKFGRAVRVRMHDLEKFIVDNTI